ncbi:39S ribosomal protein L30 [Tropilaelaps mercedesae]|uniref:39S ribosomal protein L30 n=1 Tax=Tropilaelaps mercedesae TaxID=418985 RepID=A0A1V9XIJ8_9ACAR|nr:39S ribosomal protein L30 [Tropilaelaps mercedesae]
MFRTDVLRRLTGHLVETVPQRQTSIDTYARAANEIFDRVRKLRENADKIEPPKLFLVERIADTAYRPRWEKEIMELLGLKHTKIEKKMNIRKNVGAYVVVKNTPKMCRILWRVKHLIRVKPITFPDGLPTPGVFTGTYLGRDGVFRKDASFEVDSQRLLVDPKFQKVKLTGPEIAKPMHLRWMNSIS